MFILVQYSMASVADNDCGLQPCRVADPDPFRSAFILLSGCRVADPDPFGSAFNLFFGFARLLIRIHFHLTVWVCRVADPDIFGSAFI